MGYKAETQADNSMVTTREVGRGAKYMVTKDGLTLGGGSIQTRCHCDVRLKPT